MNIQKQYRQVMNKKDKNMENKMKIFMNELISLSGVSTQYANAAWFTLAGRDTSNPKQAAEDYVKRFNLDKR